MLIQINTDNHIENSAASIAHFSEVIKEILGRYEEYITRIDAFLSDENGDKKSGADKKCTIEVKVKSANPVVVSTIENTLHQAVKFATEKAALIMDKSLTKKRVQS